MKSGKFFDFVSDDAILCLSQAASSRAIIHELTQLLAAGHSEVDPAEAEQEILDREALFPTVIAPGLAMPHARLKGLTQPLVALGTSKSGIPFGPEGAAETVQVVVLVLSPADNPSMHLQVVAALANEFNDPGKITELAELTAPDEVTKFFHGVTIRLPEYLKVADFTDTKLNVILEQDTLALAIRRFAETGATEMAVLDNDGDLRGMLALEDILRYSLPEHILWMDDLTPIYQFQPFAEMLASADETKVADVMREDFVKVSSDVPAIQLAKLFLTHHVAELPVVDADGSLRGRVLMKDFCAKLFWE